MGRHEVGFKDNTQKFPENDEQGCRMESHFLINKVSTKTVKKDNFLKFTLKASPLKVMLWVPARDIYFTKIVVK